MNIILLNPRLKTWSPNIYIPTGLAYIAATIEHMGHSVKIIDLNAQKIPNKKLMRDLKTADIIGITGMITEYEEVLRLTSISRESNKRAKIILGGSLATTYTNKVLTSSEAEIAVMGEGEETIAEVISAIESNQSLSSIKGIVYKDNGRIVINPMREPIKDIDSILYPARHLLDINRYTNQHFKSFGIKMPKVKSTTLFSSRGCPYNCTFCFKNIWGHKWRGRSPENMIGEIKQLQKDYGFNAFIFYDDTFVMDSKRVIEFSRQLIDEKLNINWYCNGRVNLMTKEMLEIMHTSGCVGIGYGLESGNQQVLDSIRKGIILEQVREVTKWTMEAGIHVTGYFMIGLLGETKSTIKETIDFARELDLNFYAFALTAPIMGTALYDSAKEQGRIGQTELEDWSFHAIANLTKDCTTKELEHYLESALREFIIEKRYGKHYLINPLLWIYGIRTVFFLIRKRSLKMLLEKVWTILRKK